MIRALAPDRCDQAFSMSVLPGRVLLGTVTALASLPTGYKQDTKVFSFTYHIDIIGAP
jgi:hypothetical protein